MPLQGHARDQTARAARDQTGAASCGTKSRARGCGPRERAWGGWGRRSDLPHQISPWCPAVWYLGGCASHCFALFVSLWPREHGQLWSVCGACNMQKPYTTTLWVTCIACARAHMPWTPPSASWTSFYCVITNDGDRGLVQGDCQGRRSIH